MKVLKTVRLDSAQSQHLKKLYEQDAANLERIEERPVVIIKSQYCAEIERLVGSRPKGCSILTSEDFSRLELFPPFEVAE